MSLKRLIVIMALAAPAMLGAARHAPAQTQTPPIAQRSQATARYARPRIEIYPRPPLYRRCVDWYELQYRPSGTVLYPQMRCWWVRG
jgi:hypothetical protein